MSNASRWSIIVVAAGRGERAGGGTPKQYRTLAGEPVLARSLRAVASACPDAPILCVIAPGDRDAFERAVAQSGLPRSLLLEPAIGGATRQASVRSGLETLAATLEPPTHVLVHDAARPFVTRALVERVMTAAEHGGAAIPGLPLTDTVKAVGSDGVVASTPDRATLRSVQTPQGFRFDTLLSAHLAAAAEGRQDLTDDAAVAEWAGLKVQVVDGEVANIKLTRAEDCAEAEARLGPALETRVGFGYDVHAFGPGEHVMLGGVAIAHDHGFTAHSDGDVALHALADAVFGALGEGDIGSHFPPSDMRWKGAASDQFLAYAAERVRSRGGRIDHLDLTIICEAPKVGPHREAMRARIAAICGVAIGRVGVKATTSERLGFTGRREGVAAQAVATVRLPPEQDP